MPATGGHSSLRPQLALIFLVGVLPAMLAGAARLLAGLLILLLALLLLALLLFTLLLLALLLRRVLVFLVVHLGPPRKTAAEMAAAVRKTPVAKKGLPAVSASTAAHVILWPKIGERTRFSSCGQQRFPYKSR